jgi:hypothetical protein
MLTDRDLLLFERLAEFRFLDCEQAMTVGKFGSITRIKERLLKLHRAGLLNRFFIGSRTGSARAVYHLNPKGAAMAGVTAKLISRHRDSLVVIDPFVEHQLEINAIRIQVEYQPLPIDGSSFVRWLTFASEISLSLPLIPDGYFEIQAGAEVHPMFLEVDRGTEALSVWKKKTELYIQLAASGEFQQIFRHPRFRVLVVAPSERRLESIRKTVAALTPKLFWFSTSEVINREGLFSAHWLRPTQQERLPLL